MGEWKETELNNLVDICSSKRIFYKEYVLEGIPFYRSKEVIEKHNGQAISTELQISVERYNEIKEKFGVPVEGDMLLTSVGTLGIPYIVQEDEKFYFKDGNLTWFRNFNNSLLNQFLYYWIISPIGKGELDMVSIGSTQPALTIIGLKGIAVNLPPLPEQKAIAAVLSSLDDKIDLLHRQNKTLEALAETLFRQWFIEEVQDEWVEGVIPDEFDFTMGLSPPGNSYNEESIGTPLFQGNADFEFRFPKNRVYTTDPRRFAEKYDTLISVRAPVGAQNMAKEKCCIGRGVAAFRYKQNNEFNTYTYFKLQSLMNEIQQYNETGTVFGSISKSDFQSFEISIPPSTLIERFQNDVKPIDDKIIKNCFQIRTLEKLSDTLLPKLLSGEVHVKYENN